ncbi:MAG: NAD(+) diphosphatase [Methyloligellaceae bacterium]
MHAPDRKDFPRPRVHAETLLNRMPERRTDRAWIEKRMASPGSRFMLVAGLKIAVTAPEADARQSLRWYGPKDLPRLGALSTNTIFLGCDENDEAVFALYLSEGDLARRQNRGRSLKPLVDLRTLAMQGELSPEELSVAGTALSLAEWNQNSACCGRCGGHTRSRSAGWSRECWACGHLMFPRMDPAVIVLVTDGERCLLGHHKRYAHKFYSTLAGFVEPGEDIESCVRREIFEETGVRIGEVAYMATQPWPFPHSLMIGCWAEALSSDLVIDAEELWDARWFSRPEVVQMIEERHPDGLTVPGSHSIAHALIKSFVEQGA